MQLLACVLLLFITTDKTFSLSHQDCGGNVTLDQESDGHIGLTLPGLFTGIDRVKPMNAQTETTLQVFICTWVIDIPAGKKVLLKPEWSGSALSISVHCVGSNENLVLEGDGLAVLSGCDGNKAKLTLRGVRHSSNVVQLSYFVQEDVRNSSESHSTNPPIQDVTSWTPTGTSFSSVSSMSQEMVKGTVSGTGHPCEGLESTSGTVCSSSVSTQDRESLLPNSAEQGLPVTGRVDRETLLLPEEKANNGADTSGHLTDAPITANERTHPYFLTEFNTDVNSATPRNLIPSTQTVSSSYISFNTDRQTSKHEYNHMMTIETDHSVSSSGIAPSEKTQERNTTISSQDVTVVGTEQDKQPHSWRSLQNADKASSDLTSATTSSPPQSTPEALQSESSSIHTNSHPTSSSTGYSRTHSSTTYTTDGAFTTSVGTLDHPNINPSDSFVSVNSYASIQTPAIQPSERIGNTELLDSLFSSSESQTNPPQSTESITPFPNTFSPSVSQMSKEEIESLQNNVATAYRTANTIASSPNRGETSLYPVLTATPTINNVSQKLETTKETFMLNPTQTVVHDRSSTQTSASVSLSLSNSSTSSYMLQTHTSMADGSQTISTSSISESTTHTGSVEPQTTLVPPQTSNKPQTESQVSIGTSTELSPSHEQSLSMDPATHAAVLLFTSPEVDDGNREMNDDNDAKMGQWTHSSTSQTPTTGPPEPPELQTTPLPRKLNRTMYSSATLTSTITWSSTKTPKFYIVPDQPVAIKEESVELLLQVIVQDSKSALTAGLEEDTAVWLEPYLLRAPGFSRLLGVWSRGHAVQSLALFKTTGALQWLSMSGPTSLLERTGLAQAVREGNTLRSSRITNITVGGLQSDVCSWLLQCPTGFKCTSQPGTANYSCSSVCHFDHCHHHGICTHHPGQLPVCRCLVGDSFWYMGKRCDVRMTRARLVGACLAVVVIIVTVIGVLAFVAVRRYRAILIQAKVDQTRSSYRRFNHFDELSGRFWLRSWAGSADSLDNPAFTRSDDLLHLRALDRPCCYHDDTLSLASTCPSHGTHINTIYPHSSQYGWRGSELSMGDGVLDSGKASDLSVCSWPVEPIHWTPFPLLQQLASHRTPTNQVRMSRPRSYCEGMELVDLGRSWTA